MKLQQIKALVAIDQTGSIQEASQILHVTQPALSRSIKELERLLGMSLLKRSYKGMSLTDEGKRLIRHAQLAMESVRRLQIEAENITETTVGEITIGVTSLTAVIAGVDDCVAQFQEKNPRMKIKLVELRPSQILHRLREGSLDFALTSQQNAMRLNLDWEPVGQIRGRVFCDSENPLRHVHSLRQLQHAKWVSLDEVDNASSQFYQMFESNDIRLPQTIIECSSIILAIRMVLRTGAFITLSELGQMGIFPGGQPRHVVEVKLGESIPDYPIFLVSIDRNALTTPARDLFLNLKRVLRQQ